MLSKLSVDNKIIVKNFSYLTLMKFFNLGFKVLLVGYLIRVLGKETYGLVTWLDSSIQYFIMIVNFGFNIYVAKYIVELKNDKEKLNEIVSSVFYIKGFLFLISIAIVIGMSFLGKYNPYQQLFVLLIFTAVGEVLFPIWFFQGQENLKPATFIVFISRLILILLTISFVKSENDSLLYVVSLVISSVIMGFLGLYYLVKVYHIKFVQVPIHKILFFVKESLPFFLGRFLSLVFNYGTIYLIGEFCKLEQVSGFDISLKIIMVGVIPFEMLQQAVFPTIARTKNKKLLKRLTVASLVIGSIIGFIMFLFADKMILLFAGKDMLEFVPVLKTLSILLPFVALTFILGSCSLVAFGYFKEYNLSLIITSIIYIIIVLILYFYGQLTFWNLIYLRIFGDILMVFIRYYFSVRKKILV